MTVVGYVRVSTDHQSLEAQQDALRQAGAERVFTDKLSGVRDDRAGPAYLIDYVRAGDTVVVIALDRLGRSLSSVIRTVEQLTAAGVLLRSLREGIDYSTRSNYRSLLSASEQALAKALSHVRPEIGCTVLSLPCYHRRCFWGGSAAW